MTTKNDDWERWLTPDKGKYLIQIKDAIRKLDEEDKNNEPMAFYTPHGPKHFQMVEDNLHKLIPNEEAEKLLEEERFYLLASAWLHDIGMYRLVARDVWGTELDDNEIRENHHITSAQFIVNNYERCGLKEEDKEFLATLCEYHRRKANIEQCPTEKSVGVGNKRFKLKLLAAYLRLADSLDIGTYRTPTPAYAICLAYNMPHESKMHWIKNRIIGGIFIDSTSHKISVEFMEPKVDQEYGQYAKKIINEKLVYVIDSVMQDLHEELNSVKQILISNNVTYFLEIKSKRNIEYVPKQIVNDLVEMVANYDILVHPSASRLLEMILLTIANICGFHLFKHEKPIKIKSERNANFSKIKNDLNIFLAKITSELVKSRPCHYGLTNLLNECVFIEKNTLAKGNFDKFMEEIDRLYSVHHQYRHEIRSNSSSFFNNFFNKRITNKDSEFVMILYGYSELTIKAICGFRDSILINLYPNNVAKDFYKNEIEHNVSKRFKIFICEGQPKTITASHDKLVYHDGIRYAEALKNRNFSNIIMIPDATVSTVLKNFKIDFIVLGANGFDTKSFIHSAGHASVVNLALYHKEVNKCSQPLIVLSTSKEKFVSSEYNTKKLSKNIKKSIEISDGCIQFYNDNKICGREKIWFTRDTQAINRMCHKSITIFNPREDVIPIKDLDYIISDNGWHPIKSGSRKPQNISDKIQEFINAQQVNSRAKSNPNRWDNT